MRPATTAVMLIGFQDEYVSGGGASVSSAADDDASGRVLQATVGLLEHVDTTETLIVATPPVLRPTDVDAADPVGALASVKAGSAVSEAAADCRLVDDLARFGSRITEFRGRRRVSAFSHTGLDELLSARQTQNVVLAGALACVCVDSTARAAWERGYRVTVLSDCTLGHTRSEHRLFFERVFPLYAEVTTAEDVAARLSRPGW